MIDQGPDSPLGSQVRERCPMGRFGTPAEVAAMFRVDPKTVTRWAKAGKLTSIRTLGGHRIDAAEAARIPLRRVGMPSDIASAVLFLSSPMADFVTGQILAVDGGSSLASGGGFNLAASGPAPT